jgi:hypothetical protein
MADKIIKNKDGSFGGIKRKRLIKRTGGTRPKPPKFEDLDPRTQKKLKERTEETKSGSKKSIGSIPMPEPISPTKKKMLDKQKQDQMVKQSLTQDYAYTGIPGAIAEPAGVTIPASKKPKLALRGGGRAYGKNS